MTDEQQYERSDIRYRSDFRWADVPEAEKWKVWWGVTVRGIAAGVVFWFVIILIAAIAA